MYYATGNYENMSKPQKTTNVENKKAYIVGSGLAGLASASFLIRDGYMDGKNITIYEELPKAGGSLDGAKRPYTGYVARGGREMENHFECLWNLYSSIPSLDHDDMSVLDEYYYNDKKYPNSSNCRLIHDNGIPVENWRDYALTPHAIEEIMNLVMTPEDKLVGKTIEDVFGKDFFASNFWTDWQTMFAFETWHSAIEMRRYLMRFIHHVDGLADFTALKFNKLDDYQEMVRPLVKYLKDHNVTIQYDTQVKNVKTNKDEDGNIHATEIELTEKDEPKKVTLTDNDLVFVTNGSITESSTYGSQDEAPKINNQPGGSWSLWQNLADQNEEFGHPETFYKTIPEKAWKISATLTIKNKEVAPYIEHLTKRDLYDGNVQTGGIITITDSNWGMSFTIHRQPAYPEQPKDQVILWLYGLYSNVDGNYIKKPIVDCTGKELTEELLYHLGVPESKIEKLADEDSISAVPVHMPFITSYFQLRKPGDRPAVVPAKSQNLAFVGNFAESGTRDVVFTTEYSVRTAMEAVYQLLDINHAVPEVYPSVFDIRTLMNSLYYLSDRKKLDQMDLPMYKKFGIKLGLKKVKGTWIEELLKDSKLI